MKKWSFLVAALLMMSATVTTTSCIDNDEPEGITVLRGAKAELLKAKAALELAKAKTEEQNANCVAALAATQQAIAKQEEARVAIVNAEAKKAEAEAASAAAQSEADKAAAQKAISDAELAIERNKLALEQAQAAQAGALDQIAKANAQAKQALEQALAEIEAAKAVITPGEAAKLAALKRYVTTEWNKLKAAQTAVLDASESLLNMGWGAEDRMEQLEKDITTAKQELEAKNAVLDQLNALKDKAITEWDAAIDSLKKAPEVQKLEVEKQNLEILKIKQSAEYKAADKAVKDAQAAQDKAEGKATKDNDTYAVSAISIPVTNSYIKGIAEVKALLDKDGNFASSYKDNKTTYDVLSADDEKMAKDIKAWKEAMKKAGVDAEALQVAKCELEADKKAQAVADSTHKANVENWTKMHDQMEKGVALVTVDTKAIDKVIADYNTAIKDLGTAVTAYNAKYNEEYKKVYDTEYNGIIEAAAIKKAETALNEIMTATGISGFNSTTHNTVAKIKGLIAAYVADKDQVAVTNEIVDAITTKGTKQLTDQDKEDAQKAATAKANGANLTEATKTAFDAMEAGLTKADKAYADLKKGLTDYQKLAGDNAQALKNDKVTLDGITGVGAKIAESGKGKADAASYEVKATDGWTRNLVEVKAGEDKYSTNDNNKEVIRTAISDADAAKLKELKFDAGKAQDAWEAASVKAFGTGVHAEVAPEKCVGGSGKALKAAQDKVATDEAKIAASEDATKINDAIAEAEKTLKAEKDAAKATVKAAQDATKAAKDALAAMTKTQEDAISAANTKAGELAALKAELEKVAEAYYNSIEISYLDEDGVKKTITPKSTEDLTTILAGLVKDQKKAVEKAEEKVKTAEKELDRAQNDPDFNYMAHMELQLENAKAELEVAQKNYDFALAQLNAYVAALAK